MVGLQPSKLVAWVRFPPWVLHGDSLSKLSFPRHLSGLSEVNGVVAQLVERLICIQIVAGSIPVSSIPFLFGIASKCWVALPQTRDFAADFTTPGEIPDLFQICSVSSVG